MNRFLLTFWFVTAIYFGCGAMERQIITANNTAFEYFGRFDFSNKGEACFDWPGVYIETIFDGSSCKAVLKGVNRYDAFIDGELRTTFSVDKQIDTITIADNLSKGKHLLKIVKRTESNMDVSTFYGLILDKGCTLHKIFSVPERKIEFIGDSYTAGFSNESNHRECTGDNCDSIIFTTTNTGRAFGPLIAASFNAQYQVNAYSGKGLVRNFNGIDKGKEFLSFYTKTLQSKVNTGETAPLWNFQKWHPDVIVIGIGINDFQADPPYADSAKFDSVYTSTIESLRSYHPKVKIICCATRIWPQNTLIPRIKKIVEEQNKKGNNSVYYFEFETENTALYGHPSITDHQKIALLLQPVIASVTGWKPQEIK